MQGGLLREQLQISEGALLSMAGICISGTSRQSPCVFADHRSGVKHDQQLRDWHRKPDRIGVDQRRKNHDQNAADDKSPCHRNNERCLRLHDRLEIMLVEYGGKFYDIKRIDNYEGYTDDISLYCKLSNDQNIEVTEPDAASV